MRFLMGLSLNNLKKHAREAVLVVISVSLTVSMMAMVAFTMGGLYKSFTEDLKNQLDYNVTLRNVRDVPMLLDALGREKIDYYQINDNEIFYYSLLDGKSIYSNSYTDFASPGDLEKINESIIIEGRRAENQTEITIPKESTLQVGEVIRINKTVMVDLEPIDEEIEVQVVGRNNSEDNYNYFLSENIMVANDKRGFNVSIVFKEGTQDIDNIFKSLQNDKTLFRDDAEIELNNDYNFVGGFQSKPGAIFYGVIVATLILIVLVAAATFTLILNSFDALFSNNIETFSILRTVGATKEQLSLSILIEGLILATLGIFGGMVLGRLITQILLSYITNEINAVSLAIDTVVHEIQIVIWDPMILYLIVIIMSYLTILFALRSQTKSLYKYEAVETVNKVRLIERKKTQKTISNPEKDLARINTETINDYKGVKVTLVIITALLISLNGWAHNITGIATSSINKFDTVIQAYSNAEDIPNAFNEIKEKSLKLDSIDNMDSFVLKYAYLQNDTQKILHKIHILDEQTFNRFAESHGLNKASQVILLRDEDTVDKATPIHVKENESLTFVDDDNQTMKVKIDEIVEKGNDTFFYLLEGRDSIVMSDKTHELLLKNFGSFEGGQILIESDLSIEELNDIAMNLSQDKYNGIYISSEYFDSFAKKAIKRLVTIVTTAIFTYIGSVVLVNIVNISISNYRKRKRDIAVLKSMGASSKQIDKMLLTESLYVLIKPWIMGLVIGNILSLIAFIFMRISVPDLQMTYQFDYMSILISSVLVVAIVLTQMLALKHESKKSNIIEDIRSY